MHMNEVNVMKIFKYLCIFLLSMILIGAGCLFYAFKIEPYRLAIKEFNLNEQTKDSEEVTIVQISDLHIKEDFTYEDIQKVVNKINTQQPDIVLFTGDLYDNYAAYNDDAHVIETLQKIEATTAKIAIWGNRDHGGGASRQYEYIMEQSGFTLLQNEHFNIEVASGAQLLFSGLDDSLLGYPYLNEYAGEAQYRLLLSHEPDTVNDYLNYSYDLALSGHSHGGQIDIPFLPFINEQVMATSALSSMYCGGMYELEGALKQLYVNTGIGTTHISARFNVVPEITVFHLYV